MREAGGEDGTRGQRRRVALERTKSRCASAVFLLIHIGVGDRVDVWSGTPSLSHTE